MSESVRALRLMYSYPLRYRRQMAIPQVLMLVAQLLGIAIPIILRQAIDVGVLRQDPVLLLFSAALVLLIGGVSVGLKHLGKRVKFKVASRVVAELRRDLLAKIFISRASVEETAGGKALTRLTADTTALRGVVNGGFFELANQAVLTIAYLTVCLLIDWRITLIAAAPLLPSAIATLSVQFRLRGLFADIRSHFSSLLSNVAESLANANVVKILGREREETDRLDGINSALASRQRKMRVKYSAWNAGLQIVSSLPAPLVLFFGARAVLDGSLSVGSLVALVALIMMLEMSIHMLIMDANGVFHTIVTGKRLLKIIDAEPALRSTADAEAAPALTGRLSAQDVTLEFDGHAVLRDVSLSIEAREFVVLVGPTGGGKTQLLKLLARLQDPDSGSVAYDGVDARSYTPASIRSQVLCLPQRQWIFAGTVAENIRLARADASDDDVRAAARAAGIGHIPLDRVLAASASDLSAGERQRVGLARALLVNPAVLLLDNPTANLDAETEAQLVATVAELRRTRTVVVATQQTAFLRHADSAYVVDTTVRPADHSGVITDAFLEQMLARTPVAAGEGRTDG